MAFSNVGPILQQFCDTSTWKPTISNFSHPTLT